MTRTMSRINFETDIPGYFKKTNLTISDKVLDPVIVILIFLTYNRGTGSTAPACRAFCQNIVPTLADYSSPLWNIPLTMEELKYW